MATARTALLAALIAALASGCGDDPDPPPTSEPTTGIAKAEGSEPIVGVSEPSAWRREPPPASPDEIASLIASLGATSHRWVVDWNLVEPRPPVEGHDYEFGPFDAMYAADLSHGVRPLLVVLNAPAWAADPGAVTGSFANNPPAEDRLSDWGDFVTAVARRYPRALGVEVWNEPNQTDFWASGSAAVRPDPVRYTQLLEASYAAVKSVDPGLLVIGGALSPKQTPSPQGDIPAPAFAAAMYRAGAAAYLDAFSLHPYPGSGGVDQTLALIEQIRAAGDAIGARPPLWLTEVGVTTTGPYAVSEDEQAAALVALCRAVSAAPDVDALYFHSLIEVPEAGFQTGFGLTAQVPGGGLEAKPAFSALQAAIRTAPPGGRCGAPG